METNNHCHSCGTAVKANARRCPNCYVALGAAARAPSPLRAAPSAAPVDGQLALAPPMLAEPRRVPVGVRCPACEATVMPAAGRCSYCLEPLPLGLPLLSPAVSQWDLVDDEPEPASQVVTGQVITGPWPARAAQVAYAPWHLRAGAALIDASAFVPALVAMAFSVMIGLVLLVAAVAFSVWQVCFLQGRRGQTVGKSRVGIFLVRESDLAPIGARAAALRQVVHGVDAALLGVGYLWPLWDAKHQTFADQVCSTVVVTG